MNRTRRSGIDVVGITLGVIVILVVLGSIVTIVRGRLFAGEPVLGGIRPLVERGEDLGPGNATRVEKDEVIPAGATQIEVRNVAGSIQIRGDAQARAITVHSIRTAAFGGALQAVRVEIHKEGNRLFVEEKHDRGFLRQAGTVAFRIVVPPGMTAIDAHSVSGAITVQGVGRAIDQDLSTISGGITTDGAGDLNASSTSGSIHFSSRGSSLNVRTVSGSIDGDIGTLTPGGTVHLNSVSGSVSLQAPTGLDAVVSLHSVSGQVSCDLPLVVTDQRNHRLSGRLGKGSSSLEVGTVSGSIHLFRS